MRIVACAALAALLVFGSPRPARAIVYHGFPHLHLTAAVLAAGGGTKHFSAYRLMQRLAGPEFGAENAKLDRQYGAARVRSYYQVFTYAILDGTKRADNMLIPIPKSGRPSTYGPALARALYAAGVTPSGRFDVGFMLEVLVSHQIHHNIMGDMDRTFTPPVNGDFHVILTTAMQDLHKEYE